MHGLDDVSETMSALDLDSIVTGSVAMPDDLVPSNANDVYNNYKFDHQYPDKLPITQCKDQVSILFPLFDEGLDGKHKLRSLLCLCQF